MDLKERRLNKFGTLPVEKMSGTTRYYFKKWGHRKQEIISWEQSTKVQRKKERERAEVDKKLERMGL